MQLVALQFLMYRKRNWKMLFKLGVTVVILVAVYMFYAVNHHQLQGDAKKSSESRVGDADLEGVEVAMDTSEKDDQGREAGIQDQEIDRRDRWRSAIHLAVVVCGDRLEESLVMFKSAVLFTSSHLVFHIFTETHLQTQFISQLDFWPPKYRDRIDYRLYNITFPADGDIKPEEWRKLFKPCACQRLFIPQLVNDVDSLIYIDTDILFLSPLEELWRLFKKFNSTQLAGLAIEHEDKAIGWYNRFARHPYYGETGVNSGVMLMNLTRLRSSVWRQSLVNYFREYRLKITFGDQDLINIYFHYFPDQLYIFSCENNYRPDHCMYMSICKPAEMVGVRTLHGSRRVWFEDKQPAFKAVYKTFSEHYLGNSIRYDLLISLEKNLKAALPSNCGKVPGLFTKSIETYLNSTDGKPAS